MRLSGRQPSARLAPPKRATFAGTYRGMAGSDAGSVAMIELADQLLASAAAS